MAEGVAGDTPPITSGEDSTFATLLHDLCEDGKQMVKVTKILRKNTELLYPGDNEVSKFLDDYVDPPAYVTWLTRYLVEKGDED